MKNRLTFGFVFLAAWLVAAVESPAGEPIVDAARTPSGGKPPLKVLFIGNSQLGNCDVPLMIQYMSESAPTDYPRIEPGRASVGGSSLKKHWEAGLGEGTSRGKIMAGKWDYVVIQEVYNAGQSDGRKKYFEKYATMFSRTIRKSGAQPILFATANASKYYSCFIDNPYFLFPGSFEKLNDIQIALGKKLGIPVAAAGYAWIKYLGPDPTEEQLLDLYDKDKGHPGHKGSYIYACLLYAVITGRNPVGLTADFKDAPGYRTGGKTALSKKEAARMQKAAWEQYQEDKPFFSGHEEPKDRLERLRVETLAKAKEEAAAPGKFTPDMEAFEKRVNASGEDVRERVIEGMADMTPGLTGDAWCCLVDAATGGDADAREAALRKLIIAASSSGKINEMLDKTEVLARVEPLAMRMRELTKKKQWKELADSFKGADLSGWPTDMALDALRMRAAANFNLKNGNESEVDLKKAIALAPANTNNPSDWYNLAINYQKNLKDDGKALEAYLKVIDMTTKSIGASVGYKTLNSVVQASGILLVRKKNEEALKILETVNRDKAGPYWRLRLYYAYLEALVALDRKADAIAECKRFLRFQGLSAKDKKTIENKLREIENSAGQPTRK